MTIVAIFFVIAASLVFGALLLAGVITLARGIRSGKISPGRAKLLAVAGCIAVFGIFVAFMGFVKYLQRM